MSVKISALPLESTVNQDTVIYIVDPAGPTSYKTTLGNVANFMKTTVVSTVHAFKVDSNGNLQYTTITDSTVNLQSGGVDLYDTVDMSTNQYAYSIDANGNLIATFSY
jgi:hypothetical protein